MAGEWKHRPQGTQALAARIRSLESQLSAARRQSGNATVHAASWPVTANDVRTGLPVQDGIVGTVALAENVQVPSGFTAAVVMLTVSLDALRDGSTAGANTLTIQAYIDTTTADPLTRTFAGANSQAQVQHSLAAPVAGLDGALSIGAFGWGAASGWVSNSGICHLSALVIFLR